MKCWNVRKIEIQTIAFGQQQMLKGIKIIKICMYKIIQSQKVCQEFEHEWSF